jgi:hypothetical protein
MNPSGKSGGGWYSTNAAGWHIVNLNSNVAMNLNATATSPASPQGLWLQKDLAADKLARPLSTKPCTLAFWHHARFSDISLRKPSTSALWGQLVGPSYKADVIVNAHSHVYERWDNLLNSGAKGTVSPTGIPTGITEFVAGEGGNVLAQTWNSNDSRSNFRDNTHWGALKLTLFPDHVDYQYFAIPGTLLDSGSIKCH